MFFLAHGLGGLVLKRTLGVLFERFYDPAYRPLIRVSSGVVFLGCPSPALNRPKDLDRVSTMLRAITKRSSKSSHRTVEHITIAANLSHKFEDTGIEAPVLSVYEMKMSKVGKSIFSPSQLLVDRDLCETMMRRERLLGVECTHDEICNVNVRTSLNTTLDQELKQFFTLALDIKDASAQPSSMG